MDNQLEFEMWVTEMPDALEAFARALPADVAAGLDGSRSSLTIIEAWLLASYPNVPAFMEANIVLFDGAARYVGEVFRAVLGGHWDISFASEKDINYGVPVLVGYPGQETPLSPHRLTSAATDRRTGVFLTTVLRAQEKLSR